MVACRQGDVLSTTEAALVLHVHETTVKKWADAGHLPCWRTPGGQRRFRRADVEALMTPETTQ